jgi:hypothetical protein
MIFMFAYSGIWLETGHSAREQLTLHKNRQKTIAHPEVRSRCAPGQPRAEERVTLDELQMTFAADWPGCGSPHAANPAQGRTTR